MWQCSGQVLTMAGLWTVRALVTQEGECDTHTHTSVSSDSERIEHSPKITEESNWLLPTILSEAEENHTTAQPGCDAAAAATGAARGSGSEFTRHIWSPSCSLAKRKECSPSAPHTDFLFFFLLPLRPPTAHVQTHILQLSLQRVVSPCVGGQRMLCEHAAWMDKSRLIFNGDMTPTYAAAAHVAFGASGLNPDDTL